MTDKRPADMTDDELIDALIDAENIFDTPRMAALEAELERRKIER